MIMDSRFHYNNKSYGKGQTYIAKLIGLHKKYGVDRDFLERDCERTSTSSTIWYKYYWKLTEDGIYEIQERNNFKFNREYFIYDAKQEVATYITYEEVLEKLDK